MLRRRIGSGVAIAALGVLTLGFAVAPAHAAVKPAIATDCTFGPFGHTYRATCTDAPTSQWDLALTCQSPAETKFITYYGGVIEGSGTSYAECSLSGWTFYSWAIRNIS